ncbi:Fibrinogen-like coiled coil protein [uncultured Mediterranean phage uvMED]|nr:Fibrinogen-like coiled coil protein [uncultured Mediterranean phage uvMED]BAQ85758.1 Fibrinogen-like coiled coil protein [uncultured Mediterranean phage uvMED]BAR16071.1 Fibrinogen-like coiled coil protein [uncultured Mediterranean phage uvMED]BAR16162.1 Fibrinogen-like coiled coil protein [uncultured Mediterranean phage uvMED]
MKSLKLSENTGIQLPAKNLLMIVAGAVVATVSFFQLETRIGSLETSRELFNADLLKKSQQLPTDQEQFLILEHLAEQVENIQKEMETMRNNNVNINYAMKDIEKIKNSLEDIKDKVRANGGH